MHQTRTRWENQTSLVINAMKLHDFSTYFNQGSYGFITIILMTTEYCLNRKILFVSLTLSLSGKITTNHLIATRVVLGTEWTQTGIPPLVIYNRAGSWKSYPFIYIWIFVPTGKGKSSPTILSHHCIQPSLCLYPDLYLSRFYIYAFMMYHICAIIFIAFTPYSLV